MSDSNLQLENKVIPIKAQSQAVFKNIIGHGAAMRKIFRIVEKVANSDTTIMLNGETGTGKGLIARAIHKASGRNEQPFVQINCGATPEGLLGTGAEHLPEPPRTKRVNSKSPRAALFF
jgi:transcriptional regulator with GAF, ATPase, and Fis domain